MLCSSWWVMWPMGLLFLCLVAQPLHWNYKTADLDEFLKDKDEVAFVEPSRNPFYCIQTGKHSCYGDQSRTILRSLVENNGIYYLLCTCSMYTCSISFEWGRGGETLRKCGGGGGQTLDNFRWEKKEKGKVFYKWGREYYKGISEICILYILIGPLG